MFSNSKNCVGATNSVRGVKKHQLPIVHEHVQVDPNSTCAWGHCLSLPATHEKKCDGKGKCNAVDGGLACYSCLMSRKKNGNSNPMRWLSKCYYEMIRVKERSNRTSMTPADYKDMQSFSKNHKSRFTPEGLTLYNENLNMHECLKETIQLNHRINNKKEIVIDENIDSVDNFFQKAADLHKKSDSFRNDVITCLLRAMMVKQSSGRLNTRKEEKTYDFFRCLRDLSPQACVFVSANCGLDGKAVSDRWMRQLNQRDRGECTFNSSVKNIYNFIRTKCEQVKQKDQVLVFSMSIDATV